MNQRQLQQMMQQAQRQMNKIQEELGNEIIEGVAGGGTVKITMNGHREVQDISISPEVVDPEDIEMLQDLLVVAIRDASEKAQKLAEDRMGPLMSGMKMPGLM